jgi:hypothetical protein
MLVQPTAGEDPRLLQAGLVKQLAGGDRQLAQIAGVDSDTKALAQAKLTDDLDGGPHPAKGVVGVDQKGGPVGKLAGKGPEGRALVLEGFDERVCHRAGGRQPEPAGRLHVAGGQNPTIAVARAAAMAASTPWVRRKAKSTRSAPSAASRQRAALEATAVWKVTSFSRAVSTS